MVKEQVELYDMKEIKSWKGVIEESFNENTIDKKINDYLLVLIIHHDLQLE